ncbi:MULTISPECIES: ABC transporter permease [unclassified Luteococcus]|uniref:ABC transporter permease n=1 Tax=unclassified Luteococcus TaxID=2639923 RepID=UPI00313B8F74
MTTLAGTGTMLRLTLRRNWLFWTLWIIGLACLMPLTATQYDTIIPPGTDPRLTIEPLRNNPSMLALLGPAFDVYSKAGFVFWRVGGFASMFAGMMGGFAIIRATRGEEEEGRLELLRSSAIGRHAPLAGALVSCVLGCLVLGMVTAGWSMAAHLPAAGALAAGSAVALEGLVFVGVGAVCAQVFENARTARYWTVGLLWGGLFVLRMMVDGAGPDASYAWLNWLNPLEWGMYLRPWSDERWWVVLLPKLLFLVSILTAFRLESARDHLAGLRPDRPGRGTAPGWLSGTWGLAWRLQRGTLIGWSVALVLCSVGMGSIMSQMDKSLAANPQMGEMLQKMGGSSNLQTAFYVAMIGIMGTVAAIMAGVVLNRLRAEEGRGHAEMLLATATSRWRFAVSHLAFAVAVPCLAYLAVGAGMPLVQAGQTGDWSPVGQYLRTAAGLLPGLVLVVGIAMMLIGWLPRFSGLVWAVLGWTMFCTWFAVLFDLPEWLLKLQPWGYLAHLPRDPMDWTAFAVETALALALLGLGLVGYRRRNLPA